MVVKSIHHSSVLPNEGSFFHPNRTAEHFRNRARNMNRADLFLFAVCELFTLFAEWIVGQKININLAVLFTYALFLWVLYVRDRRFILEFFWLVTMATLNILGTFCCDEGLFLVELNYESWYLCAVAPPGGTVCDSVYRY